MNIKNRSDLAKYFAEKGFSVGAEIGVQRGHYSKELCEANPGLLLYCIDNWGRRSGLPDKVGHTNNMRMAEERLRPYNVIMIRKSSWIT